VRVRVYSSTVMVVVSWVPEEVTAFIEARAAPCAPRASRTVATKAEIIKIRICGVTGRTQQNSAETDGANAAFCKSVWWVWCRAELCVVLFVYVSNVRDESRADGVGRK